MNDGTPTHYFRPTGGKSVIDLTICFSNCCLDYSYNVNESLHSSDHYPIHLEIERNPMVIEKFQSFNTNKAN